LLEAVAIVTELCRFDSCRHWEASTLLASTRASRRACWWRRRTESRSTRPGREAIADEIEPLRRVSLHAIALQLLRSEGADPARLAHHAEATGDAEAVAVFAPIAAAEAAGRGAHREAAAQYRRALRFSSHLTTERRAQLLEHGAHETYLIDEFDEAIAWLIDAVALRHETGDILREGDAMRQLSTVQRCGGRRADAHSNGAKAVALLETQPAGAELAAAHANVAMLAMNSSDIEVGIAAARTALDLAAECGDRNVHVHAPQHDGCAQAAGR
jgi:tetratricopeptide (TPR) repeat protein